MEEEDRQEGADVKCNDAPCLSSSFVVCLLAPKVDNFCNDAPSCLSSSLLPSSLVVCLLAPKVDNFCDDAPSCLSSSLLPSSLVVCLLAPEVDNFCQKCWCTVDSLCSVALVSTFP